MRFNSGVRRFRYSKSNMRNLIINLFVLLISLDGATFGQSKFHASHDMIRQNPHGWFAVRLPADIRRLDGPIDVDGGRYESGVLEINFDYWTYQNTPNWLRGNYATHLLLACPKSKSTRTDRTWIDGYRAVIQRCHVTDERKGRRNLYYVTFPKLKVFDGEKFHNGMFNLRIEYRDQAYTPVAAQIVRSFDFER
jgi:hypothetical protein